MYYYIYKNWLSDIILIGDDHCLYELKYLDYVDFNTYKEFENDIAPFKKVIEQLDLYFKGKLFEFDIKMCLNGTNFQLKVWNVLSTIKFGETLNYQKVARMIQHHKAQRAVGNANNKNPIAIIIPCHRVIKLNSKTLGGYANDVSLKIKLYNHERFVKMQQNPAFMDKFNDYKHDLNKLLMFMKDANFKLTSIDDLQFLLQNSTLY